MPKQHFETPTKNLTHDVRSHSFNVGVAIDYGVNAALFIDHIAYWTEKNLSNNKHVHDGLVWSYNTIESFTDIFPYFTRHQLEHLIKKCVDDGLIAKGNYNKVSYDRTSWYALTPKSYFYFPHLVVEKYLERLYSSISENSEMDFGKFRNGFRKIPEPIPSTDPSTDSIIKGASSDAQKNDNSISSSVNSISKKPCPGKTKLKVSDLTQQNPYNISTQLLIDWIEVRKTKRAAITLTAWNNILSNLKKCQDKGFNPIECFEIMVEHGWSSLKVDWIANTKENKQTKDTEYTRAQQKRYEETKERATRDERNKGDAKAYRNIKKAVARRTEGAPKELKDFLKNNKGT